MGNEVSQPTNYNNETLNKINNVLDTNTEMYEPNQITQSGGNFEKGVKVQSKKTKKIGTIIERVTNSAFPGNIWKVTFDNGDTREWPESDLTNLKEEEDRKRIAEAKARESEERRKRDEVERKQIALDKQKKQIEDEIRKNELLIENFGVLIKKACEQKEKEFLKEKDRHIIIVTSLKQKLASLK
jgi:hypothetical protein